MLTSENDIQMLTVFKTSLWLPWHRRTATWRSRPALAVWTPIRTFRSSRRTSGENWFTKTKREKNQEKSISDREEFLRSVSFAKSRVFFLCCFRSQSCSAVVFVGFDWVFLGFLDLPIGHRRWWDASWRQTTWTTGWTRRWLSITWKWHWALTAGCGTSTEASGKVPALSFHLIVHNNCLSSHTWISDIFHRLLNPGVAKTSEKST